MTATVLVQRFRTFLLVVAGCMCVGTIIELWLAKHTKTPMQLVPFGLCALGGIAVMMALIRPHRRTLIALRIVMAVLLAGSALGIYEHLAGNIAFALDIRPTATVRDVFVGALRGNDPLLAPGILALASILALAATYYHPALGNRMRPVSHAPEARMRLE